MELISFILNSPITTTLATMALISSGLAIALSRGDYLAKAAPGLILSIAVFLGGLFVPPSGELNPKDTETIALLMNGLVWSLYGLVGVGSVAGALGIANWIHRRRWPIGQAPNYRIIEVPPVFSDSEVLSMSETEHVERIEKETTYTIELRVGRFGKWVAAASGVESHAKAEATISETLEEWWAKHHAKLAERAKTPEKPAEPRRIVSKKVYK